MYMMVMQDEQEEEEERRRRTRKKDNKIEMKISILKKFSFLNFRVG